MRGAYPATRGRSPRVRVKIFTPLPLQQPQPDKHCAYEASGLETALLKYEGIARERLTAAAAVVSKIAVYRLDGVGAAQGGVGVAQGGAGRTRKPARGRAGVVVLLCAAWRPPARLSSAPRRPAQHSRCKVRATMTASWVSRATRAARAARLRGTRGGHKNGQKSKVVNIFFFTPASDETT